MGKSRIFKAIIIWIIKLSVVGGIFAYLFRRFSFTNIINNIVSADFGFVSIALLLNLIAIFILAYQLKIVFNQLKIPMTELQLFRIGLIMRFYGLFLPGLLSSGAVKWYKITRYHRKYSETFVSLIFLRGVNMVTILVFGLVAIIIDNPFDSFSVIMMGGIILAFLLLLYVIAFNKTAFLVFTGFIKICFPKAMLSYLKKKLGSVLTAIDKFRAFPVPTLRGVLVLSACSNLLVILLLYILSLSVDIPVSIYTIAWIASVVNILRTLPISISGLGIREGLLVFFLGKYGIAPPKAIAFSLIIFGVIFIVALVGGVLEATGFLSKGSFARSTRNT